MENIKFNKNIMKVGNYAILKNGVMKTENLHILDTGNKYGCMTTKTSCYPREMTLAKRQLEFLKHRKQAAHDHNNGFNPYKFFMPVQTGQGNYIEITRELADVHKDAWDTGLLADILVITKRTPSVVIGSAVADYPVVIASDLKNGVTAAAPCSPEMIGLGLPKRTVETLQSRYNSKKEDIYVYVGAHANSEMLNNDELSRINEDFYKKANALEETRSGVKINLDKALLYQLNPGEFESFIINQADTRTNRNYYSNSVYNYGEGPKEKDGRHFEGAYYQKVKRL